MFFQTPSTILLLPLLLSSLITTQVVPTDPIFDCTDSNYRVIYTACSAGDYSHCCAVGTNCCAGGCCSLTSWCVGVGTSKETCCDVNDATLCGTGPALPLQSTICEGGDGLSSYMCPHDSTCNINDDTCYAPSGGSGGGGGGGGSGGAASSTLPPAASSTAPSAVVESSEVVQTTVPETTAPAAAPPSTVFETTTAAAAAPTAVSSSEVVASPPPPSTVVVVTASNDAGGSGGTETAGGAGGGGGGGGASVSVVTVSAAAAPTATKSSVGSNVVAGSFSALAVVGFVLVVVWL